MLDGFLVVLTGAWLVFALVQDWKTREIANWLTFSLLASGLAYRVFDAFAQNAWELLWASVIGIVVCAGIGLLLYYGRAFGGGDAKLLIALGAVLPYTHLREGFLVSLLFILLLFSIGAGYTLVYSLFLIRRNVHTFIHAFKIQTQKVSKQQVWWFVVVAVLFFIVSSLAGNSLFAFLFLAIFLLLLLLYLYVYAVEQSCLIVRKLPGALREGDWLVHSVRAGGKRIQASVHGLSRQDILLLRQHRKAVFVKEGIPFMPAFVLSYGVMVYVVWSGMLAQLLAFLS